MKNDLHTLENYTYGLNGFNVSTAFGHFRQEMKFCSFLEKTPISSTDPKKKLMSGGWYSYKKIIPENSAVVQYFMKLQYFHLINQSDRPESRKDLHKTAKSFSINL